MGRSPEWFRYVRPFPPRPAGSLSSLEALFSHHLTETPARSAIEDEVEVAFTQIPLSMNVGIRIDAISDLSPDHHEGLMRCCSTYGQEDEDRPQQGLSYRIEAVARYRFIRHAPSARTASNEEAAVYDVLYVSHPDPGVMSTWVLRTDGLVLNLESFQPVCWVDQATASPRSDGSGS